ncbi:MAG: Gfo/Idh/MocA family protein [Bryobacteraceae bacterium]
MPYDKLQCTRRGFLASAPAAIVGSNGRINVGIIGTGGVGTVHLRAFVRQSEEEKDIQVVAASDLYRRRLERAKDLARLTVKDVYPDYQDLLARRDVDAVLIAVPDHWHARIALDALAAGKDVYLEKPMAYTIEEARDIAAAVKKHNRILQVGSQGMSYPATHIMREIVERGEIGDIVWAQGTSARNSVAGEWNYPIEAEGTPETIDWKRWLGAAPARPFSAERFFRWRKYWDYSGGIATDLFYHTLAPILYVMGAQLPTRVTASGGVYVHKDREVPDTYATLIEYPNFYINLSGSTANAQARENHGTVIYGHLGTIVPEETCVRVIPETRKGSGRRQAPKAKVYELPQLGPLRDGRTPHTTNFFACVRSRKTPNLHAELGYQIMVAIKQGVDFYRKGAV